MDRFIREKSLIGEQCFNRLKNAKVAVFGLGGVGSFACEALVRAGVGSIMICDNDVIAEHNINRQLFALSSTVGQYKADVCANRMKDINPSVIIESRKEYFDKETACSFDFSSSDFIADCIDSVTSKILLAEYAKKYNVPIISCMGTGNKTSADFMVADLFSTSVCPLAKVMRKELKARGFTQYTVLYSEDKPRKPQIEIPSEKRQTPASISYVPSMAGLKIAQYIIEKIAELSSLQNE